MEKIKTRAVKNSNMKWRSISIPESLYEQYEKKSEERGESISLLARKGLEGYLKTI